MRTAQVLIAILSVALLGACGSNTDDSPGDAATDSGDWSARDGTPETMADAGSINGRDAQGQTDVDTGPDNVVNALADPSAFGWPDEDNTGPSDPDAIPGWLERNTAQKVYIETAHDGQVIENVWTRGIKVLHDDVTIRNFVVEAENPNGSYGINMSIHTAASGERPRGVTIEDGLILTIDGPEGAPTPSRLKGIGYVTGSADQPSVVRRVHIHHCEDGIGPIRGTHVTIEDSFIHDLIKYEDAHNDGIVITGGSDPVADIFITHNTVLLPNQQTGCFSCFQTSPTGPVTIDGNLFNGGSYTIYGDDQGGGDVIDWVVKNNRFGRDYNAGLYSIDGDETTEGNVWDDDNTPANDNP